MTLTEMPYHQNSRCLIKILGLCSCIEECLEQSTDAIKVSYKSYLSQKQKVTNLQHLCGNEMEYQENNKDRPLLK